MEYFIYGAAFGWFMYPVLQIIKKIILEAKKATVVDNQKNHEFTGNYCLNHGFKLNLQMHLYASLA